MALRPASRTEPTSVPTPGPTSSCLQNPLHPLVQTGVCVCMYNMCVRVSIRICTLCKKVHGGALAEALLGPTALGGAAAGPGHECPAGQCGAAPGRATPAPAPAPTRRHRPREAPCSVIHADDAWQGERRPLLPARAAADPRRAGT